MLETATTTELKDHYAQAHVARAEMFAAVAVWVIGAFKRKGPQFALRPSKAVAC